MTPEQENAIVAAARAAAERDVARLVASGYTAEQMLAMSEELGYQRAVEYVDTMKEPAEEQPKTSWLGKLFGK